MKTLSVLILSMFLILFSSCTENKSGEIILNGEIKGLSNGKVYLHDAYDWYQESFDSAVVKDGKFTFRIKTDTVFTPQLVSVLYQSPAAAKKKIDPDRPWKNHILIFIKDQIKSARKKQLQYNPGFMLEQGVSSISGEFLPVKEGSADMKISANLKAGKQNEFYWKNQNLPFIRIQKNPEKRAEQIGKLKRLFSENSKAYYAISSVQYLMYDLSNKELSEFYAVFDPGLQNSHFGKRIKDVFSSRIEKGSAVNNDVLLGVNNQKGNLIEKGKLNLVVFWASWCGPCRQEIPVIKKLAERYAKDKKFTITSVSIDKDEKQWRSALKVEKMNWRQLIVPGNQLQSIVDKYNANAIPKMMLVSSDRRIIEEFTGFEKGNEPLLMNLIQQNLKN